jgi:hypothetical protein
MTKAETAGNAYNNDVTITQEDFNVAIFYFRRVKIIYFITSMHEFMKM